MVLRSVPELYSDFHCRIMSIFNALLPKVKVIKYWVLGLVVGVQSRDRQIWV